MNKPMQGLAHPCNNVTAHRGGVFICQAKGGRVGADSFCMGCPIVKYPASLADTKQSGGVVEARERKATIESAMNMARAFAGRYKNGYWQADGERKFSEAKADFESRLDRLLAALQAGQQPEPASEPAPSVQPPVKLSSLRGFAPDAKMFEDAPANPNCPIKCNSMAQCSGACDFMEAAPQPAVVEALPDMQKIESDALSNARLLHHGKIAQAYRLNHAQGKTEEDFDRLAWQEIAESVRYAVRLTAREVREPVWPYALASLPEPIPADKGCV